MAIRTLLIDPMLRMLAGAVALALVVPASGTGRTVAEAVANLAVFTLFLLNGMKIARAEVTASLANWRYLAPLTAYVFFAMALMGLCLMHLGSGLLPPLLALGLLYLGTLTSTVQSATSYTTLAGGNTALAVVSAAMLNLLGVAITVPVFAALGGGASGAIGWATAGKVLALLVLPFILGQAVQNRTRGFIARHRERIVWIDRWVIAIAVYVAFSGAVTQGIGSRVGGTDWLYLCALVALFLGMGHGGAWLAGGALNLLRRDRIAFLFAGAQKSAAVGAPLATVLFPAAEAGFIVMPLLLYHLLQLVVAAPLASRLAGRSLPDDGDCSAPTTPATKR